MKYSVIVALSAAVVALGESSTTQAAMINFTLFTVDGTPTYTGPSLDASTALDFDDAFLFVSEVGPTDVSGLSPGDSNVSLTPTNITYGSGTGTLNVLADAVVTKSWTSGNGDVFTEKLTQVDSINRLVPNMIIVTLSGLLNDTQDLFVNTPAVLVVDAIQFGGVGTATSVTFTNTAGAVTPSIPEPSSWVMMALGFGALGYAGFSRRKSPPLSA